MDNKKYIDKVIEHLVRSTKIDYEKELIVFPPLSSPFNSTLLYITSKNTPKCPNFFSSYCKNTFGLTKEEIIYVYIQWRGIMRDKIKDGE